MTESESIEIPDELLEGICGGQLTGAEREKLIANAKRLKHDGWALTTIIKVMRADWQQTDVEERIALLQEVYDSE